MSSAKGKIIRMLSGVVLERANITTVKSMGAFRKLLLQRESQEVAAGTKVQLLLPSDDMRTYTPIASPGGLTLLGWLHAGGPGADWMSKVRPGDEVLFLGPQRSLDISPGPLVIVGDETSLATAAAFVVERPSQVAAVIQAQTSRDVAEVASDLGLEQMTVLEKGDALSTVRAVETELSRLPGARVVVAGGSELVVAVRDALRRAGVGPKIQTKTYWIRGKKGLD